MFDIKNTFTHIAICASYKNTLPVYLYNQWFVYTGHNRQNQKKLLIQYGKQVLSLCKVHYIFIKAFEIWRTTIRINQDYVREIWKHVHEQICQRGDHKWAQIKSECWIDISMHWQLVPKVEHDTLHGPLTRYVKLWVAHAPGMPRTFSPLRVSDTDMHHGTWVTHVPWFMPGSLASSFLWSRWRGKRSGIPGACTGRNFTYLVTVPWPNTTNSFCSYSTHWGLNKMVNIL